VLIKRDPDLAADTLIKLSDLLRFQLYECSGDKIAIEKELEYLRNFVELEKMRKGERVQVIWEQEGDLRGFSIAPLLLIPFVENAFKYVSNHSHEANVVHLRMKRSEAHFEVWLSNSTEPLMSGEPGGIGIQNVRRRLELIYPGKHTLEIRSQPHEFSVTLCLTIDE
jgi:two-component system, LytTR family, sensor kinase